MIKEETHRENLLLRKTKEVVSTELCANDCRQFVYYVVIRNWELCCQHTHSSEETKNSEIFLAIILDFSVYFYAFGVRKSSCR